MTSLEPINVLQRHLTLTCFGILWSETRKKLLLLLTKITMIKDCRYSSNSSNVKKNAMAQNDIHFIDKKKRLLNPQLRELQLHGCYSLETHM